MSWHNKVVWTEGMFLQPQHFQQHDRFLANQMQAKVASMSPYHWGFADLQIDEAALAMGKLALVSARGVLPDGTAFSMPIEDAVPAALDIGADVRNEVVVLAVALPRPGVVETDAEEAGGSTPPRLHAAGVEVADSNATADRTAEVLIGRLNARLMLARDAGEGRAPPPLIHASPLLEEERPDESPNAHLPGPDPRR